MVEIRHLTSYNFGCFVDRKYDWFSRQTIKFGWDRFKPQQTGWKVWQTILRTCQHYNYLYLFPESSFANRESSKTWLEKVNIFLLGHAKNNFGKAHINSINWLRSRSFYIPFFLSDLPSPTHCPSLSLDSQLILHPNSFAPSSVHFAHNLRQSSGSS